jgi:signal transduction histidine kinase
VTLRSKIVLLVVVLTVALLAGLGAFLGGSWSRWSRETLDSELGSRAASLVARVEVQHGGEVEVEGDLTSLRRDASHPFRVLVSGRQVEGSGASFPWPDPVPGAVTVRATTGAAWRVVTVSMTGEEGRDEHRGRGPAVVQVAGQEAPFAALGERFRQGLLAALAGALVLGSLGAGLLAHLSLRPLHRLAGEVESIDAGTIDRRVDEEGLDPELRNVAGAFNRMLGRLEEAMERQRRFISRASHSLRTPTATILTRAEVALRRDRPPDEYRAALADIAVAARESAELANHLLSLARLDEGRSTLQRDRVQLAPLAAEVARLVAPRAADVGVGVEQDVPDGLEVDADRASLRELLDALLDNALHHTPRGGRCGVRAQVRRGTAAISVWDTGPGIPEAERAGAFERFSRGSAALASGRPGSGLGLAIVKAIADAHGAPITLGERPGGGALVSLEFPIWKPEPRG